MTVIRTMMYTAPHVQPPPDGRTVLLKGVPNPSSNPSPSGRTVLLKGAEAIRIDSATPYHVEGSLLVSHSMTSQQLGL